MTHTAYIPAVGEEEFDGPRFGDGATSDDTKLTNVLTYLNSISATSRPIIRMRDRTHDFYTPAKIPCNGLYLAGPNGNRSSEAVGSIVNQGAKINLRFDSRTTNIGWWHPTSNTQCRNVTFENFTIISPPTAAAFLTNAAGITWWLPTVRNVTTNGLHGVLGTHANFWRQDAANVSGAWNINNAKGTSVHTGGSDSEFFTDGCLLDSGSFDNTFGYFHFWADGLTKCNVGPLYITASGDAFNNPGVPVNWPAVKVSGSTYNGGSDHGPVNFRGIRCEGRNAGDPSYGYIYNQTGGHAQFLQGWTSYGMADTAAAGTSPLGVMHVTGGKLSLLQHVYDRATGIAETVPMVYATGANSFIDAAQISVASSGGVWTGKPRIRAISGATVNNGTGAYDGSFTLVSV